MNVAAAEAPEARRLHTSGPVDSDAARADAGLARPVRDGPEIPPLARGLPHTHDTSLKALWLNVLLSGLRDAHEGVERFWIGSDDFFIVCDYIGIDAVLAERISEMFWDGKLDMKAISYALCGMERAT